MSVCSFEPLPTDCLLVVDLQPDFMPLGRLPVAGGDVILNPILETMQKFRTVVATQDWHPHGHISFASSHPGKKPFDTARIHGHEHVLWPDHCTQGHSGADLPRPLERRADIILRKGANPAVDSYSAFNENWGPEGYRRSTGLMGAILGRYVRRLVVCGLARDVCVLASVQDAGQAIPVVVLWDLTCAVDPSKDEETEHLMRRAGLVSIHRE